MKEVIKHNILFAVVFFIILSIDIYVKLNFNEVPYRIITKPLVMLTLILYYYFANKEPSVKKNRLVIIGLFLFLFGDIALIFYEHQTIYILGLVFFILGKVFYILRFSNQSDFKLVSLLPFFIICFIYMATIMFLVIDNLGNFFIPTLIYLFACLITILFAFLRKNEVNRISYILVLIGVFFTVICDSISLLQSFYSPDFPYHEILIMLFYGISQYFIVLGLIKEKKQLNVI